MKVKKPVLIMIIAVFAIFHLISHLGSIKVATENFQTAQNLGDQLHIFFSGILLIMPLGLSFLLIISIPGLFQFKEEGIKRGRLYFIINTVLSIGFTVFAMTEQLKNTQRLVFISIGFLVSIGIIIYLFSGELLKKAIEYRKQIDSKKPKKPLTPTQL